jgi:hypothetical protein
MKRIILILVVSILIFSCNSEKTKPGNMQIHGYIKELRKGTVYLRKFTDSTTVILDSAVITDNSPHFKLATNIKSPEVFSITLKERANDRMIFFGEQATINVYSNIENMELNTKITGSKNQKKWDEYKGFMRKFNDQYLDYMEIKFNAAKNKNQAKLDSIEKVIKAQEKRRLLYQINFAMTNKNLDIAPFVAITDLVNVRKKYLDTIYNGLNEAVKKNTYGLSLKKMIADTKE